MGLASREFDGTRDQSHQCLAFAANSQYTARYDGERITVQSLNGDEKVWSIDPALHKTKVSILQFSSLDPDHLAIASKQDVVLVNVANKSQLVRLPPQDAAVSAIAWHSVQHQVLATGHADGQVKLWKAHGAKHIETQQAQIVGPVVHLAWSASDESILVIASPQQLCIWHTDISYPYHVAIFEKPGDSIAQLQWHFRHARTLLTASKSGQLSVWDFTQTTRKLPKPTKGVFAKDQAMVLHKKLSPSLTMTSQRRTFTGVKSLLWTTSQTALVLYADGTAVARVDVRSARFGTSDWSTQLDPPAERLVVTQGEDQAVLAVSQSAREHLDVELEFSAHAAPDAFKVEHDRLSTAVKSRGTMTCIPISALRRRRLLPANANERRPLSHTADNKQKARRSRLVAEDETAGNGTPDTLLGLVGLPVPENKDDSAAMPFLSPTVPARTFKRAVDPLDEAHIELLSPSIAPVQVGSFSSTPGVESDSDDEFGLESKSRLPAQLSSGRNVPSARSCAGVFAADGTLVIFRPSVDKPKLSILSTSQQEPPLPGHGLQDQSRQFPAFGNLFADLDFAASTNTTPSGEQSIELDSTRGALVEALGLDRASVDSKTSWKPRSLTSTMPALSLTSRSAMTVTLHVINMLPLAKAQEPVYATSRRAGESFFSLCQRNAMEATKVDRSADTLLWTLLGQVLGSTSTGSTKSTSANNTETSWADHPLGRSWLVRRLFAYAETAANLRMLAYISIVVTEYSLISVAPSNGAKLKSSRRSTTSLAVPSSVMNEAGLLVTLDRVDSQVLENSPTRTQADSIVSSRQASQPTTPRIDSSSSTPPWSFSGFPQPSHKLSNSGSASPEHTRGSFTAAVKSYAQSVSDKFAVYSTSPPIRRSGPSPNKDFPTSSQSGAGSWSKTVSFASNAKSSGLGRQSMDQDTEYDSERTIEDTPSPEKGDTCKSSLKLVWKNTESFADDGRSARRSSLIPDDMLQFCMIWCSTYAIRLRSLSQDLVAVQFDKVSGIISSMVGESSSSQDAAAFYEPGLLKSMACSICMCQVTGLEQVCLVCSHAYHMSCLTDLDDMQGTFFCPSGCGCECELLASRSTLAGD